jgi:hypothetical protein
MRGYKQNPRENQTLPAMSPFAKAALRLGAKGLRVFPCLPRSKKPCFKDNLKLAAVNPLIISKFWERGDFNVAIATGRASGVWVLDIDNDDNGEQTLRELEAKFGSLPPTVEVITGNGRHLYFLWPDNGVEIRNFQQREDLPGLDVRGEGGYVLCPPSIHPSGRAYEWSVDSADAFADAPQWLLELVTARSQKSGNGQPPTLPATWQAVMEGEHEDSRRAGAVAKIFGHLVRKYVDPAIALGLAEMFDRERNKPPLGQDEVIRICRDIAELEAERRGQ